MNGFGDGFTASYASLVFFILNSIVPYLVKLHAHFSWNDKFDNLFYMC